MTIISKILPSAALAAVLVSSGAAFAQSSDLPPLPEYLQEQGNIRFGVKCDSPPFGASGPGGEPIGIEVEMARKIAEYGFGSPDAAELSCVTSESRIPSLNGNKIDLILATLGRFPEREAVIDFSDIYFWGASYALVPKDSAINSVADLAGRSILIVKGASQTKWLEANVPDIEFIQLNTTADGVQALLQGRADAFVGDGGLIFSLAANYPELRIVEDPIDPGMNGIGVRKDEPETLAFLNAALARMKEEGFYRQVVPEFAEDKAVQEQLLLGFETDPPAATN